MVYKNSEIKKETCTALICYCVYKFSALLLVNSSLLFLLCDTGGADKSRLYWS